MSWLPRKLRTDGVESDTHTQKKNTLDKKRCHKKLTGTKRSSKGSILFSAFPRRDLKMTIKKVSIEYDALNSKNVFTNGDTINGRIIVLASKDSPIRSLVLIAAGVARVHWTEGTEEGEIIEQEIEYYGIKHCILEESRNGMYKITPPQPSMSLC